MDKLEIVITALLVCLVAVAIYAATSWTLSKKKKCYEEPDHDKEEGHYKYQEDEIDNARKKVATAYAKETMPRITLTPVQPRAVFPRDVISSDEKVSTGEEGEEEEEDSQSDNHPDLGRLYFSLRYDEHRSMLMVRLIRAEDIPVEDQSLSTYVDVYLLPQDLQSETFQPHDATINVTFREVYKFPLSQSDMALQTLNLHICRYDNYSRRTSVGDVFLALAELGAQGIDLTREVFLCRNIISHQEIHRVLGKKKHDSSALVQDHVGKKAEMQQKKAKRKRVARKVSSQKMWEVLRRAVRSGSYKGAYLPIDSAMHWESIFSPGTSSAVGFVAASSSPLKSTESFFVGHGPPDTPCEDTVEDCGASWLGRQEGKIEFPPNLTDESEYEFSAGEQDIEEQRYSSPVKQVQLSPAPEEYYRIVPITPFKGQKESTESSHSWKLPERFTSRDYDLLETLSYAYSPPRVLDSKSRHAVTGAKETPPSKQDLFAFSDAKMGKEATERKDVQKKISGYKKPKNKSKRIVLGKHLKNISPRKEPEGDSAEKRVSFTTIQHSIPKFLAKSSLKRQKRASWQKESDSASEGLTGVRPFTSERLEEELSVHSSPEVECSTRNFQSISSPTEYLTTPMCALKDFSTTTRSQSDPSVDVERFRRMNNSSEIRRTHSMLVFREDELAWEEM